MSRDTETWAAQRSSFVGPMWRSLFSTWTPRDANFYTNRDTTALEEFDCRMKLQERCRHW